MTDLSHYLPVANFGFQLSLVTGWLVGVVGLAEWLHRHIPNDSEMARKVVHIGSGNVILLAWWLQFPAWIILAASGVTGAIALLSYKVPILPSVNSIGRHSLGTFFYAVSIGVLTAWFWTLQLPHYTVLGILIMAWGDGLAAVIGQHFGRHRYRIWGIVKSWEGSLAMTLSAYGVCSLVLLAAQGNLWQTWVVAFGVAIAATALEAFSKLGIDNLTVPLGSAALCFALNHLLLA